MTTEAPTKCDWCIQREHFLCLRGACNCPCGLPLTPPDTMPSRRFDPVPGEPGVWIERRDETKREQA